VGTGGLGEMSGMYRQCESKQRLKEMSEIKCSDIMTCLQKPYAINTLHLNIAEIYK
jgi:hypothetical protein